MTNEEIIKALECCNPSNLNCMECPLKKVKGCTDMLRTQNISLLNQQSTEIDQLKSIITDLRQNSTNNNIVEEIIKENKQLKAENEQLKKGGWISVKDRLPQNEKRVLAIVKRHSDYTNKEYKLTVTAIYEDGTVSEEESCWQMDCEWLDYNEESDSHYMPKGWYEFHEYGDTDNGGVANIENNGYLHDTVTHWQPLPNPPKEDK